MKQYLITFFSLISALLLLSVYGCSKIDPNEGYFFINASELILTEEDVGSSYYLAKDENFMIESKMRTHFLESRRSYGWIGGYNKEFENYKYFNNTELSAERHAYTINILINLFNSTDGAKEYYSYLNVLAELVVNESNGTSEYLDLDAGDEYNGKYNIFLKSPFYDKEIDWHVFWGVFRENNAVVMINAVYPDDSHKDEALLLFQNSEDRLLNASGTKKQKLFK